ncbi:unnamed protein product [Symbiodinium sp. CCMP2592]|nr:unnamed protein product [Symbiodinium sp. CCMP2592]
MAHHSPQWSWDQGCWNAGSQQDWGNAGSQQDWGLAQHSQQQHVAPSRERLDGACCMLDKAGHPAAFSDSRISQQSGSQYEGLVASVINGLSRKLKAVRQQGPDERTQVEQLKENVAAFLRERVSDNAGQRVLARGVGEEEAEIDAVFHGSFGELLSKLNQVTDALVLATYAGTTCVLVEACSDSRLVAMKLLQIEIQCRLVERCGFLVNDEPRGLKAQQLDPDSTGYAIVFNRAALQIDIQSVLDTLGLTYVQELLQKGKLHIAFLQADRALPAALEIASEAKAESSVARAEANEAREEANQARVKVDRLEQQLAGIRRVNICMTYARLWFLPWHVVLRGSAGRTSTSSVVWVREVAPNKDTVVSTHGAEHDTPGRGFGRWFGAGSFDTARRAGWDGRRQAEAQGAGRFGSSASAQIRSRQDPEGEDELEPAFKVESPQAIVAVPCEAIKQMKSNALRNVDPDQIDIYLYSQEAGKWQLVKFSSTSLRQDTSEPNPRLRDLPFNFRMTASLLGKIATAFCRDGLAPSSSAHPFARSLSVSHVKVCDVHHASLRCGQFCCKWRA